MNGTTSLHCSTSTSSTSNPSIARTSTATQVLNSAVGNIQPLAPSTMGRPIGLAIGVAFGGLVVVVGTIFRVWLCAKRMRRDSGNKGVPKKDRIAEEKASKEEVPAELEGTSL